MQSRSRQVLDLPELPRLHCVQHLIQTRLCPCCGKLRSSQFPAEASAPVCYGPRIKALGIYLVSYQHLECPQFRGHLIAWVCPTRRKGCGVHATHASPVPGAVPP